MIPFHFQSQPSDHVCEHSIQVPAGIRKKADLLAFLALSIPLPDYFGHNWDALEECLAELGELDGPQIILLHHDIPLENEAADQRIYLQILARAARESKRLSVIFPENYRAQISSILK